MLHNSPPNNQPLATWEAIVKTMRDSNWGRSEMMTTQCGEGRAKAYLAYVEAKTFFALLSQRSDIPQLQAIDCTETKKKENLRKTGNSLLKLISAATYSPTNTLRSTIGEGGLNCRVRHGTGCVPSSVTTENLYVLGCDLCCFCCPDLRLYIAVFFDALF